MAKARARPRSTRSPARAREDAIFRALADGTRRELLYLLAQEERSVHRLAEHFAMSRPAVSKHLAVLRRAGLVSERAEGRERVYTLQHPPLEEVLRWVAAIDAMWAQRLDALGRYLDRPS